MGALATKNTVGTADIDAKAVTTEKLAEGIVTSLGKADTALQPGALSDYQTKAQADAAYAVKTLEDQVGDVSAENMHTTASTVVTAIAEVADEAGAAQSAADTAQATANAAIPKPAGSCTESGATCVLVYNGTSYSWEDIARATEE